MLEYKADAALALWSYVGSQPARLPIVIEFDGRSRVESVCLEEGARVGRSLAGQVDRAMRALRSMPPGPGCLAGKRLGLAEAFAEESRKWRRKRARAAEVEHRCLMRDPLCVGRIAPVCALRSDGSWHTYRDACEACRDPFVTGYNDGDCSRLP